MARLKGFEGDRAYGTGGNTARRDSYVNANRRAVHSLLRKGKAGSVEEESPRKDGTPEETDDDRQQVNRKVPKSRRKLLHS